MLLVDGEPVPYALARMPSADDHRGNLAAGAKGVGRPLNERDRWLARQIGPALRERGMLFVGLDVIGGFVTEINVTSPTGHPRARKAVQNRYRRHVDRRHRPAAQATRKR